MVRVLTLHLLDICWLHTFPNVTYLQCKKNCSYPNRHNYCYISLFNVWLVLVLKLRTVSSSVRIINGFEIMISRTKDFCYNSLMRVHASGFMNMYNLKILLTFFSLLISKNSEMFNFHEMHNILLNIHMRIVQSEV
jgi:hypothetical protein